MSRKTVAFKTPGAVAKAADGWVASRQGGAVAEAAAAGRVAGGAAALAGAAPAQTAPADDDEVMRRFTIDVSDALHKRIKAQCALRGVKMADALREILEREFPRGA